MFKKSSSRKKAAMSSRHRKEVGNRGRNGKGVQSTIQTRSIERVLAPIAAQVSQLIILNETAEREGGKLPNLIPFAQTVLRATEELVQVGHKMAKDTDDEKLQREMPEVCDASIAAGRSMLMAVQRLQAEPLSEPARDNMVTAARRLLETTMKVLLISDDADVRRILDTCAWVTEGLQNIRAVGSMKELVATFKDFSESVVMLCDLCDKRQQDLNSPEKKERILSALSGLKRAMPLLNSSMQSYVKYPTNIQAKASRDYSCNQVGGAVKQITDALTHPSSGGQSHQATATDKPGHFAYNMEKLVEMLSPNMRLKLNKDFTGVLEQAVRHGMSVAAASRDDIKDEIVTTCKQVLQLRTDVMRHLEALQDNGSFIQLTSDFEGSCEGLAHDLLTLESLVKSAIVHQVVDAFTETTEPLDRMVKTSTVRLKEKGPLREDICTKLLQPLDDVFHDHADQILQMASLVAASCVDSNQGQEILTLVRNMEQLDADVFPSCLAVRKDLTNKGAVEHLKLVRREWHSSVLQLVDIVDTLIEASRFIEVSESCLEKDVEECRQAGLISDAELVSEAVGNILGRCRRVLQVAKQHQDKNEDAVYRNGLQVFIGQLENALPLVKNGGHYLVGNIHNKRAIAALSEHNYHLLQCVRNLCSGLDASHHPDILSPLRGKVRGHQATVNPESFEFLRGVADEPSTKKSQVIHTRSRLHPEGRSPEEDLSKSVRYLSLLDSTPSFHLPPDAISTPNGPTLTQPKRRDRGRIGNEGHLLPARKITKDMIQRLEMAYPMNELVRALFTKQWDQVALLCRSTKEKVDQYLGLIKRMNSLKLDSQKIRLAEAKVADLQRMTSDLIHHFESSLHGSDSDRADAVIRAEKWSGHVTEVAAATRELIGWCGVSSSGMARHDGNDHMRTLQSQIDQVTTMKADVMRLISVAIGWKESLQAMDGGDTPTHAMHIQQMQSRASDWSTVTSELHSLANESLISPDDRELADKLERLNLGWSISTMELLVTLDNIILGQRSSEFIGMVTAIRSGQEDQVMQEVKWLNVRCKMLKEQSRKALASCGQASKELDLDKALKEMENCTSSLATSSISMATTLRGQGSPADGFRLQRIALLQREWIVKTQIVECMLESFIIEMLIPLDRLTGTALAARQAQGPSRQQIMEEFQAQAEGLTQAVTKIKSDCALLLQGVFNLPEKDVILQCSDALSRITPGVVAKLRMIADHSSMNSNDDLMNQKREWACNAKALIQGINNLPGVDFALKQEMTRSLLQDHSPPPSSASSSIMHPSPRGGGGVLGGAFNPLTVPQLTPEQWRVIQSLPQHGIQLIQTPSGAASPYFHGSQAHHFPSGMTTPNHAGGSPRLFDSSPSPRPQVAATPDLSPGRLRSLHQSHLSGTGNSQGSPTKKPSPQAEGTPGPYRSRTLGIESPGYMKLKSASTSSLQSVNSTGLVSESGSVKYSNSITAAALALQQETDRWEDDKNEVIKVARVMSQKMRLLAKYARRHCCMEDKEELISTAKAVAANGLKIAKFADIIARNCTDHRFAEELRNEAQHIPTFSTQLDIIASVKAATPDDLTSNAALVKNAENLMTAVVRTLKAAEAACVKGLKSLENEDQSHDTEAQEAKALAMQWKRKLHRHRLIEASTEDTDHLGLRKIKKNISAPSLTEIVMS